MILSIFEIIFSLLLILGFINEEKITAFENKLINKIYPKYRNKKVVRKLKKPSSVKVINFNEVRNSDVA